MTSIPVRPTPTLWSSSGRIFELSLGQMLWSRRSVFLALLTAGPVFLALAARVASFFAPVTVGGGVIFGTMMWLVFIRFAVPVLGVFYGTGLIADEVEDRTITYLFTRPIPRGAVLLGKYLAYLACTVLLILPSVVLIYFLVVPIGTGRIGANFPLLLEDLGMLILGLAAYGGVFALVGARFKRPLVTGLLFVFGWEPWVLFFPGYLKYLSVAHYLQALVPHAMPDDSSLGGLGGLLQLLRDVPGVGVSLAALAVIIGGSLFLAMRTVEHREYVLEQ